MAVIFLVSFFSIILTGLTASWLFLADKQLNQNILPILLLIAFIFAIISALRTK